MKSSIDQRIYLISPKLLDVPKMVFLEAVLIK